jgi:hypothetical protein
LCDVSQISCSFGHIAARRLEYRRETSESVEHRPLGGGSGLYPLCHISQQRGVISHHRKGIQDVFRKSASLNAASTKVGCGLAEGNRCTDKFGISSAAALGRGWFGERIGHTPNVPDHEPSTYADSPDNYFAVRHSAS